MSLPKIAVFLPVSNEIIEDGFPVWKYAWRMALWQAYAKTFGESRADAVAIIERGTAEFDLPIYEDEC